MSRRQPPTQIQAAHSEAALNDAMERQRQAPAEAVARARESERVRREILAAHEARIARRAHESAPKPTDTVSVNGAVLTTDEAARWMSRF